tara:strand:+ start:56 stop:484 length:429 start_codon:yes stop_codon:yes gene_type:complete
MRNLILLLLLVSCNKSVEKKNTFYAIDPAFSEYVLDFTKDLETIGEDLNNDNLSFSIIMGRLPRNVVGIAIGMDNDYAVNVVISQYYWNRLNKDERKMLIYHELSHDVFNITHGTCRIMDSSFGIKDLDAAIVELMNVIKNR